MSGENTRQAVAWADSLPEGIERDTAHDSIYQATPRGVGAMLTTNAGFPEVLNLVAGGPLAQAGFQKGDMLTGIETPGGQWHGFAGVTLENSIQLLRGEPGTSLTVVAMRNDARTGKLVEYRATVTREQIVFSPAKQPTR